MMRTPLLAANWKMFKTIAEAEAFVLKLRGLREGVDLSGVEIVIAPPFTALSAVAAGVRGTGIGVAGQDLHWEAEGAFTGAVSAGMLVEAGATHVIVGHSERRRLFGDTDETVNRKTKAALAAGLVPIVCVGETLEERDGGEMPAVLTRQVRGGLDGLSAAQVGGLVLAYEPVWAIGTGRTATAAQAGEAHAHIRSTLGSLFGADAAASCRILYGGSVKPGNVRELVAKADVDGALVGGASLDPESFHEIVAGGHNAAQRPRL
jgi:triosephosphate isomerase